METKDIVLHTTYMDVIGGETNLKEAPIILTKNELAVIHINFNDNVYVLLYPSIPVQESFLFKMKVKEKVFYDLESFDQVLSEVIEELFGEGERDYSFTDISLDVALNAPIFKHSGSGNPLDKEKERRAFLAINSLLLRSVYLPVQTILELVAEHP